MNVRALFWKIGATLCMVGAFRIIWVREAWERTTFHPNYELDTPALLVGLGLIFIAVWSVMTFLESLLRRRGINKRPRE